jgi:Ca2+-binding RTX toxin-like protein
MLIGTINNDTIVGTIGNDDITAGLGNDLIAGGGGNDHIYFSIGDGVDIIQLSSRLSATTLDQRDIVFSDVSSKNVSFSKAGFDLQVNYSLADVVTIKDYFYPILTNANGSSTFSGIGSNVFSAPTHTQLVFSDKTLSFADIDAFHLVGTVDFRKSGIDASDYALMISGNLLSSNVFDPDQDVSESIFGGREADVFYSNGSDATQGQGLDYYYGFDGSDTYILNRQGVLLARDISLEDGDIYQITAQNSILAVFDENYTGNGVAQDVLDLSAYQRSDFIMTRDMNDLVLSSELLGISVFVKFQYIDYDKNITNSGGGLIDPVYSKYNSSVEKIVFSDQVILSTDAAISSLKGSASNSTLDLVFCGQKQVSNDFTGNTRDEYFYGGNVNDSLHGSGGNDYLYGYAGNDLLDGGLGNDLMKGGLGDDSYTVDSLTDSVIELAAEGTDKITTALDGYTLGENVEWLYLTGATALTASGNELDNRVYGNNLNNTLYGYAGNDRLNGGVGNDTMIGGVGNDVYVVSSTKDVIVEDANEGTDGVEVGFSYTLQTNIENLTLGGTGNINGTGNSASNVITGNASSNVLDGKAGSDTLVGKLGNDTYLFNRGNMLDTIVENDSTAGNADVLKMGADIRSDQLWFKHVGNNLEVRVIGTTDRTVIRDWYLGDAYHVETINAGDGKTLSHQQVENLVSAMSTMTMPASGQTSLSVSQQSTLAPVLAANWH